MRFSFSMPSNHRLKNQSKINILNVETSWKVASSVVFPKMILNFCACASLKCWNIHYPLQRWRAAWFAQSWSWTTTTGSPTLTRCQSGSPSYFFRWSTLLHNKSKWQMFVIIYKVSTPIAIIPPTLPLSGCPGFSECPDLDDRSQRSPSSCK